MLRGAVVLFSLVGIVIAAQVPFTNTDVWTEAQWSLNSLPDRNGTDHLVFETVHSLLQHWPNTRMRNGHNIVPGRIPKGTLLYHGTWRNELPPGPEWVATDPEHSYYFCRASRAHSQQGCWHLTLVTTRPLKVIYFDGNSAAKIPYGTMDTQDLLVWGRSHSQNPFSDFQRIRDLCAWGEKFGVDGFVRMEMNFEVMLCNFTSGVGVVSFSNLVKQRGGRSTELDYLSFEVYYSGSWHNHFPGETRVQLDLSGLVSFYDTTLVPSLIDIRAGQERWDHRVQNISCEDLSAAKSRLEASLVRPDSQSSGNDWSTLIQVIVDRYAGRLELTRLLLNSPISEPDEIINLAKKTQTQLRIMLTPYLLLSVIQADPSKRDANWMVPIYKLCATTHTYVMSPDLDSMTDSENLLLRAVRGTTREICRVVTKMWTAGVYAGIDTLLNTKASPDIAEVTHLWNAWTGELGNLMAWLDWNVWIKCNPSCGPEEMCYLPTWPNGFPGPRRWPPPPDSDGAPLGNISNFDIRAMAMERLAEEMRGIVEPGPDDWIRPQPRCVRRIDPYDL